MPTLYASPSRVVIYTDGDTSPETASPPDLSRVKFDTDLNYVRVIREATAVVALPSVGAQTSGNTNPVRLANFVLENHGLGYTPLVFGWCTVRTTGGSIVSGQDFVPLRGSVPIQEARNSNNTDTSFWDANFCRFLSLGSSSTQVILNEYLVRPFFAINPPTAYPARNVTVTYYITDEAL